MWNYRFQEKYRRSSPEEMKTPPKRGSVGKCNDSSSNLLVLLPFYYPTHDAKTREHQGVGSGFRNVRDHLSGWEARNDSLVQWIRNTVPAQYANA